MLAAQHGGVDAGGILAHAGCGVEHLEACALAGGEGGAGVCACQRGRERFGQRAGIARRHEPRMIRPQRLGDAADIGRDDRQTGGHRLQHDKRQALERGGEDQQVGLRIGAGHVVDEFDDLRGNIGFAIAALDLAAATQGGREYVSIEEVAAACPKVSSAHI